MPYDLGYTLIEEDERHMVELHIDRVRARLSGTPFDYLFRPYTFRLADYLSEV